MTETTLDAPRRSAAPAAVPAPLEAADRARQRRRRRRTRRWAVGVPLWILAIAFLAPFAWMLSTSFKNELDAYAVPMEWIPSPAELSNYTTVLFGEDSILPAFANSVFVALLRVAGELVTATMAGYAFARFTFKGRDKVFLLYLATAIIPAQLLLVPRFIYFQQLGLYDTLWALILPGMFTVLGTFLMRQFFVAQPSEFAEAARMDGASEWRIFTRIYVPLASPVMAALGILAFVWSWNDYETPLVLISSPEMYTLPLSLTSFTNEQGALSPGLAMAASVVTIVPVLVVFLLLQRRFVQALTHTGIK
ncbi:carbohydrate ABC transporter permease [Desertihabitans aurantiacus]|uniref:carbohydrate ABC transporter permease n=1 Tax=Desertihabitans aurantiacus TaxID=2282477 RepID=UPI000DF825B2|nr:carbohydrate ABC transporter permease [Desertihabitans aurantiacus]